MNHLLLGTADKAERLLAITKPRFLLIDDGPIADAFLEHFPKARLFDPAQHSFNPLAGMDYRRARDFSQTIFPDKDLMTYDKGKRALTRFLLAASSLADLPESKEVKNPWQIEALERMEDLLLSPVVRRVLCGGCTPFKFGEGTTVAKLDRAELGDDDAFVLGSLIAGQHKGQIVLPDFGFYGRPLHMSFIRQGRMTAGLRYLDELPMPLQRALLTIEDKHFMRLLPQDAQNLIGFSDNPSGNPKNLM